jgi:hypothetical protein
MKLTDKQFRKIQRANKIIFWGEQVLILLSVAAALGIAYTFYHA